MKSTFLPIWQWLFAILGAVCAYLQPAFPFILVCTLAILVDCLSAYRLSCRVRRRFPDHAEGKFKSSAAKRVFNTLAVVYILILLVFLVQKEIFHFLDMHLPEIVAGAFCFIQIWSILENESSCNGARWAKTLQQFMVDKTERHFNVDLSALKGGEQ